MGLSIRPTYIEKDDRSTLCDYAIVFSSGNTLDAAKRKYDVGVHSVATFTEEEFTEFVLSY